MLSALWAARLASWDWLRRKSHVHPAVVPAHFVALCQPWALCPCTGPCRHSRVELTLQPSATELQHTNTPNLVLPNCSFTTARTASS